MQFTSLSFALFVCILFYIYWLIPVKGRPFVLLIAGYLFYLTFSPYAVILLILISFITYFAALSGKKPAMITGMIIPVALLVFFKYGGLLPSFKGNIAVPVGVSFYFFKSISYLYDVYKGKYEPEKKWIYVFLYLNFMPDLLAGPINRADKLIPELKKETAFNEESAVFGLRLILLGLFRKIVVANTLSIYTDRVFASPGSFMGLSSIIAMIFYTIQIYMDFAGYSEIARGCAALFNIRSAINFKRPYFSESIGEFWRRWHISLSEWLRDYVYIPLGGSKKGKVRTYLNLLITFLVSGIWHGAGLNFIIWGMLHGIFQIFDRVIKRTILKGKKLPKILGRVVTFILAAFAWVFFRAENLSDAIVMIGNLFYELSPHLAYLKLEMTRGNMILIILGVLLVFIYDVYEEKLEKKPDAGEQKESSEMSGASEVINGNEAVNKLDKLHVAFRFAIYLAVAVTILLVRLHVSGSQEFIYFNF